MGAEVLGLFGIHKLRLATGGHRTREEGLCVMEAVAWFANEPHGDHPKCVDPVLGAYCRPLNDQLTDDERQGLVNMIPRLAGTTGSAELGRRRSFLLVDRVIRQILPLVYDERWPEHAKALRGLAEVRDEPTARTARTVCNATNAAATNAAAYAAAYAATNAAAYAANAATNAAYATNATNAAACAAAYAANAATNAAAYAAACANAACAGNRSQRVALALAALSDAIDLR